MANVTEYNYQFTGGPTGYANSRCIIRLRNGSSSVAYIYFVPDGQPIPPDTDGGPWIKMYLPESMILTVVDQLRNESPISVYYASGSAFLHTGREPIGEGEE
ncbi:MAG: hypothetical protein AAF547_02460 [Actinomycetota bacterium]